LSDLAGPERIAKAIVETLIQDLKFRPGDFVIYTLTRAGFVIA